MLRNTSQFPVALSALFALAVSLSVFVLGSTPTFAAERESLTVSVRGMSCESCAAKATEALESLDSVSSAKVDVLGAKAVLDVAADYDRDALKQALANVDLELLFADETAVVALTDEDREKYDIEVITRGKKVDLKDHLVEGKFTLFDFMADWCKPCEILTPKLEQMVVQNDDVALRLVDIVDWKSDMAKHATKKWKLTGIPFVRVFGPDGKHIGDVTGLQPEKIKALIEGVRS